jgi:Mn-dependent DtxR family transcriptional regulator
MLNLISVKQLDGKPEMATEVARTFRVSIPEVKKLLIEMEKKGLLKKTTAKGKNLSLPNEFKIWK